jgi:hypothetical protein
VDLNQWCGSVDFGPDLVQVLTTKMLELVKNKNLVSREAIFLRLRLFQNDAAPAPKTPNTSKVHISTRHIMPTFFRLS